MPPDFFVFQRVGKHLDEFFSQSFVFFPEPLNMAAPGSSAAA
jgi:hypothetical protein